MTRRSLFVLAATFALALAGCAPRATSSASRARPRTTVEVRNNAFVDQVIYASVGSGVRQRLGTALGISTTTLVIPASLIGPGTRLRLVAEPVGGGRATIGEETVVDPGDALVFVIMGR